MAYGEKLGKKVRQLIKAKKGFEEKKMFGGVCYLLNGNMAFGILNNELIVRVGPENYKDMLQLRHTREFDITGRPMKGWIMVADTSLQTKKNLTFWVEQGVKFAQSLPAK